MGTLQFIWSMDSIAGLEDIAKHIATIQNPSKAFIKETKNNGLVTMGRNVSNTKYMIMKIHRV